ncbi:MAG TPA: flagellar basal body rod C-terminal domain-containing protein [Acetobacteraceae bacterium]|nr:flagellar basal body rod C-terminal domain-containing protein [Acetobacteraceae bacterium]
MSLEASLSIARSGLLYTQRALSNAANNVANAETEGYTRKTVAADAREAAGRGIGVRTREPTRDVDEALIGELNARRGALAGATARERLLQRIEMAHGRPEAGEGIGDLISGLRRAFTELRAEPASQARQGAAIGAAETLARRLNTVSGAVQAARQEAQDGIVAEVGTINAMLNEIADLTGRIRDTIALGLSPAELEDRRDAAIALLSESLGVAALKREDGGITLIARGGMVLPLHPRDPAFSTADASLGPPAFHGPGGTIPPILLGGNDVTGRLLGGRLAELVALRDTTLPRFQAELDVAAASLAWRFESQGLRLFTAPDGSVPDATQPYAGSAQLGFAGTIRVNAAVTAAPWLLRDGTHAVVGAPGGASAFTPNAPGGPAGFAALLDRVLDFTFGAEAAAGAPWPSIATGGLGPDGTLASPFAAPPTLEGFGGVVAAAQTAERAAASERREGAAAMKAGLEARFAQRSGVDVDAEMAAMVSLQNAYAANAKVMATVQQMWDSLLGAVR